MKNQFFLTESSRRRRAVGGKRPIVTSHDLNIAVKVAEDFVSRLQRLEGNLAGKFKLNKLDLQTM